MKKQETTAEAECVASNAGLYVIAGTFQQACDYAIERGVGRSSLVYISRADRLRGLCGDGQTVYVYGTASDRKDYDECTQMAIERRFQLEYV